MASAPSGIIRVLDTSPTIFAPGRCPPIPGLAPLAHFDLDGRAGVQICLIDAEAAGGHLYDSVGAVGIEIPVQSALAGVVADAQFPGSLGQCRMGVCS